MSSAIEKAEEKQEIENPKQREAFLAYFELGAERSLENVRQKCGEIGVKIGKTTIEQWCKKFNWVERVKAMDQEVTEKTEELAIKNATLQKSEILKAVKNTMIQYNNAVVAGTIIPSASDFKKMWEVMRIELGKTIGIDQYQLPSVNIYLTKNEKIINIVKKAEEELEQAIREEIHE